MRDRSDDVPVGVADLGRLLRISRRRRRRRRGGFNDVVVCHLTRGYGREGRIDEEALSAAAKRSVSFLVWTAATVAVVAVDEAVETLVLVAWISVVVMVMQMLMMFGVAVGVC